MLSVSSYGFVCTPICVYTNKNEFDRFSNTSVTPGIDGLHCYSSTQLLSIYLPSRTFPSLPCITVVTITSHGYPSDMPGIPHLKLLSKGSIQQPSLKQLNFNEICLTQGRNFFSIQTMKGG